MPHLAPRRAQPAVRSQEAARLSITGQDLPSQEAEQKCPPAPWGRAISPPRSRFSRSDRGKPISSRKARRRLDEMDTRKREPRPSGVPEHVPRGGDRNNAVFQLLDSWFPRPTQKPADGEHLWQFAPSGVHAPFREIDLVGGLCVGRGHPCSQYLRELRFGVD